MKNEYIRNCWEMHKNFQFKSLGLDEMIIPIWLLFWLRFRLFEKKIWLFYCVVNKMIQKILDWIPVFAIFIRFFENIYFNFQVWVALSFNEIIISFYPSNGSKLAPLHSTISPPPPKLAEINSNRLNETRNRDSPDPKGAGETVGVCSNPFLCPLDCEWFKHVTVC